RPLSPPAIRAPKALRRCRERPVCAPVTKAAGEAAHHPRAGPKKGRRRKPPVPDLGFVVEMGASGVNAWSSGGHGQRADTMAGPAASRVHTAQVRSGHLGSCSGSGVTSDIGTQPPYV